MHVSICDDCCCAFSPATTRFILMLSCAASFSKLFCSPSRKAFILSNATHTGNGCPPAAAAAAAVVGAGAAAAAVVGAAAGAAAAAVVGFVAGAAAAAAGAGAAVVGAAAAAVVGAGAGAVLVGALHAVLKTIRPASRPARQGPEAGNRL